MTQSPSQRQCLSRSPSYFALGCFAICVHALRCPAAKTRSTRDDELTDVLRLSKGMTYKNATAGLPLGGGKCVIIADPSRTDKPDLLRAFSRHVQALGGRYWTTIDVGVGPADADILAENCDFIFARERASIRTVSIRRWSPRWAASLASRPWPPMFGTGPTSRGCASRSRALVRRAATWRGSCTKLESNSSSRM